MYMYIRMCTYVHIHVDAYVYTYICTYIQYMYVCVYIYIYIVIYLFGRVCVYLPLSRWLLKHADGGSNLGISILFHVDNVVLDTQCEVETAFGACHSSKAQQLHERDETQHIWGLQQLLMNIWLGFSSGYHATTMHHMSVRGKTLKITQIPASVTCMG